MKRDLEHIIHRNKQSQCVINVERCQYEELAILFRYLVKAEWALNNQQVSLTVPKFTSVMFHCQLFQQQSLHPFNSALNHVLPTCQSTICNYQIMLKYCSYFFRKLNTVDFHSHSEYVLEGTTTIVRVKYAWIDIRLVIEEQTYGYPLFILMTSLS